MNAYNYNNLYGNNLSPEELEELEAEAEEAERLEDERYHQYLNEVRRSGLANEQRTALARMIKPREPGGESLKNQILKAASIRAGSGSPAEFTRYAKYLSKESGVPLTEVNIGKMYGKLRGIFNKNRSSSGIARGPVPMPNTTIPATQKTLPENYTESPVELTGNVAFRYTYPPLRAELGLNEEVPLSKAKRNAEAAGTGAAARRRNRRTRRTLRTRRTRRSRR